MNILYLSFPQGGLDTSVIVLGKQLMKQGHRVSVLYIHSSNQTAAFLEEGNQLKIYHGRMGQLHYYFNKTARGIPSLPKAVQAFEFSQALKKAVKEISKKEKIDLIEIPEISVSQRAMRGIPYVVRLHSADWTWRKMLGEPERFFDKWDQRRETHLLRNAAGVSSPSLFLKSLIQNDCPNNHSIELIPYPVNTGQFNPAKKTQPPLILFVGRVEKRKGADVLLDAVPKILAKFPDCRFVFIGSVCDDLKFRAFQAPPQVSFLNSIPHGALPDWYQKASLFVAPSRWDNSPNTIYEAMACGTPVIASRAGGMPELVDEGVTGLLVPPGDADALYEASVSLLSDPGRREQMGQKAHEKVDAFYAVDKVTKKTVNFYERALAKL